MKIMNIEYDDYMNELAASEDNGYYAAKHLAHMMLSKLYGISFEEAEQQYYNLIEEERRQYRLSKAE